MARKLVMLTPGTMGLQALAIDVFGLEACDVGIVSGWGSPVYVDPSKVPPADLEAGLALIKERGLERNMPITSEEVTR